MTAPALQLITNDRISLRLERARLRSVLQAIYETGGMDAVNEAVAEETLSLAAQVRAEIAEEGWIG